MESRTYDRFPASIVLLSNLLAIGIYVIGAYVLAGLGLWFLVLYLAYCLWIEFRILKGSCVNCYYYGKRCGLGKGRICALFFKQGDPDRFAAAEVSWWDVAPDFLVSIFPLVGGMVLLTRGFSWSLVLLLAALLVLSFGGTAVVRGSLLCKHCRQRELGCPAQKLFGGERE